MARERKPKTEEIDPLIQAEEERYAKTGERRVFYHPGHGCNGVAVGGGEFKPNAIPDGYEYDLDNWPGEGPARIRKVKPVAAEPAQEQTDKP